MNRLLDRLEFLQALALDRSILSNVQPHRVARLRRQGERYFAGDLRDISGDRRLAILAVCALEWRGAIADAVVETHDRIVGKTWREAKSRCDARMNDAKSALKDTHDVRFRDARGHEHHAVLSVRHATMTVRPPIGKQRKYRRQQLQIIHAEEINPPEDRAPIFW